MARISGIKINNVAVGDCSFCCVICDGTCCCDTSIPNYRQKALTVTLEKVQDSKLIPESILSCMEGEWCIPFKSFLTVGNIKYCIWENIIRGGNELGHAEFKIEIGIPETLKDKDQDGVPEVVPESCVNVHITVLSCEDCNGNPFLNHPQNTLSPSTGPSGISSAVGVPGAYNYPCEESTPGSDPDELEVGACGCSADCWEEHDYGGNLVIESVQVVNEHGSVVNPSDDPIWLTIGQCIEDTYRFVKGESTCTFVPGEGLEFDIEGVYHVPEPHDTLLTYSCYVLVALGETFLDCIEDALPEGFTVTSRVRSFLTGTITSCGSDAPGNIISFLDFLKEETGEIFTVIGTTKWVPDKLDSCSYDSKVKTPEAPCPEDVDPIECEHTYCGNEFNVVDGVWEPSAIIYRGSQHCTGGWKPEDYFVCTLDEHKICECNCKDIEGPPEKCLCNCVIVDITLFPIEADLGTLPDGARIEITHSIRGEEYRVAYTRVNSEGCDIWEPDWQLPRFVFCVEDMECTESRLKQVIDTDLDHNMTVTCNPNGDEIDTNQGLVQYEVFLRHKSKWDELSFEDPDDCYHYYWIRAEPCTFQDERGNYCTGEDNLFVHCEDLPEEVAYFIDSTGHCYKIDPEGDRVYKLPPITYRVETPPYFKEEQFEDCDDCCPKNACECPVPDEYDCDRCIDGCTPEQLEVYIDCIELFEDCYVFIDREYRHTWHHSINGITIRATRPNPILYPGCSWSASPSDSLFRPLTKNYYLAYTLCTYRCDEFDPEFESEKFPQGFMIDIFRRPDDRWSVSIIGDPSYGGGNLRLFEGVSDPIIGCDAVIVRNEITEWDPSNGKIGRLGYVRIKPCHPERPGSESAPCNECCFSPDAVISVEWESRSCILNFPIGGFARRFTFDFTVPSYSPNVVLIWSGTVTMESATGVPFEECLGDISYTDSQEIPVEIRYECDDGSWYVIDRSTNLTLISVPPEDGDCTGGTYSESFSTSPGSFISNSVSIEVVNPNAGEYVPGECDPAPHIITGTCR